MEQLDYYRSYCELTMGGPAPIQRRGKFILVKNHGQTLLILGMPKLHPYHADIMAAYCDREDIGHYRDKSNGQTVPIDAEVRVMGGGRYDIDDTARSLRLYDYSTAYGHPHLSLLPKEQIAGYLLDLSAYSEK